ncbi:MAG: hypothetical protein KDN20_11215 [Verrucomicrobiae bacterium]|nr:hypothetical protein [Verrucomicrobiae bacterium]
MITTALVISVAFVMIAGLTFTFRHQMRAMDVQSKSQVKIDYSQKEDAVLRALLHTVPNKAIGAMMRDSAIDPQQYSWESAFQEAISLANAETAIDADIMTGFGVNGMISANSGDSLLTSISDLVSPAVSGGAGFVNAGNTRDGALFLNTEIADKLPAPLQSSSTVYELDKSYPIISLSKTHHPSWTKGLLLSPSDYPLYNQYTYPNIRFGYARPGDPFLAKRNWWVFSLRFGGNNQGDVAVPTIRKNYLLSIYEVPSQLPMSSAGFMSVGRHADGTAWNQAQLSGGVFADRLQTEGTVALTAGLFSARTGLDFSDSTSVAGVNVANNFDAMGVRELRQASNGSDFHDASVGGNVGRVAFIPLNQGNDFLIRSGDGSNGSRISPTGWNDYTRGAEQAKMWFRVWEMASTALQIPIQFRFYYQNTSGARVYRTFTRGYNWPTPSETGGDAFPFQTETLPIGRNAITVHLDLLPAFLLALGDAADVSVNNSIYLFPQNNRPTVVPPSVPSIASDPAVSVRGGSDMSAYTTGFSVVSNLRMYIGESLNTVPVTPPSGSGIPAGEEYFPPISLFAPEKRFGETAFFEHPVEFTGQVSSLNTDDTVAFRPLDLRSGSDDTVSPGLIEADLKMIQSPAELPPIHLMNWLVTIEEIHQGPQN